MINNITTIKELLYWSYSNLAMAHSAVDRNIEEYDKVCFMIRSRLYKGLISDKMSIGTILDDERVKMSCGNRCAYCGSSTRLSIEHIIPRIAGGTDNAENIIFACKNCNSSKNDKDLMEWYESKNIFPPLSILRRYLKIVYKYCVEHDIMDKELKSIDEKKLPFRIDLLPKEFPQPKEIKFL